jgi:Calcineurin-like phosphoesterase
MIDEVRRVRELMDPRFLHSQLDRLQQDGAAPLSDEEYAAAVEELTQASSGPGLAVAFFPRHPGLSMLQSVLETCLRSRRSELLQPADGGDGKQPPTADAELLPDRDVFRKFGPCDPRWISVKIAEGLRMFGARPDFPAQPAPTVDLADDARVVLVGDWGTGLPGAEAVGQQMARELAAAAGRDRHVIHLGDVYYSGWREEYERHFLPYWPHAEGDRSMRSWALNGNHDMYSGGHGYFGFLLRDPRFAGHQGSSHIRLAGRWWQLLGLDTSYVDHDLAGDQAAWVQEQVAGTELRTMLLSHHQLFSAFDPKPNPLGGRLAPTFGERRVDAWFWGHEHRCVVYDETDTVRFASCIGHGGVPVLLSDPGEPLPPGVRYLYQLPAEVQGGNRWGPFGFVVLDFDGPSVLARYINHRGEEHHREQLS